MLPAIRGVGHLVTCIRLTAGTRLQMNRQEKKVTGLSQREVGRPEFLGLKARKKRDINE